MRITDPKIRTQIANLEDLRRMVGPDRHRPGSARARLIAEQIPVWAIIGHVQAIAGTSDLSNLPDGITSQVAVDYDVPHEAVLAAMLYYEEHRCAIDTLLEANAEATS